MEMVERAAGSTQIAVDRSCLGEIPDEDVVDLLELLVGDSLPAELIELRKQNDKGKGGQEDGTLIFHATTFSWSAVGSC